MSFELICMTPKYESHVIADEFPMMSSNELSELIGSIRNNGFDPRHPIQLFEGKILDGRNRYKASLEAGVEPVFAQWDGPNPYNFVWRENATRRHLEPGVKAAKFLRFKQKSADWEAEKKRIQQQANEKRAVKARESVKAQTRDERGRVGKLDPQPSPVSLDTAPGDTDPQPSRVSSDTPPGSAKPDANYERTTIANEAGVSPATVARALELQRKDPEAFEQVAAGKVSLNRALTQVKAEERNSAIAAQVVSLFEQPVIKHTDAVAFLTDIAPGSADLLFTDPPYSTDVDDLESFVDSWLDLALSRVKPSGRAYICIGAYPHELEVYLTRLNQRTDFTLANILVWTYRNTMGPSPKLDYKLNWQAILYLRGPKAPALDCPVMNEQFTVQDINAPDGRLGDRFHAWQKPSPLAERIVRHSTKHGDLVIDPFACTGTFLVEAARLGRRAMGCDISNEHIEIAESRGCQRVS